MDEIHARLISLMSKLHERISNQFDIMGAFLFLRAILINLSRIPYEHSNYRPLVVDIEREVAILVDYVEREVSPDIYTII